MNKPQKPAPPSPVPPLQQGQSSLRHRLGLSAGAKSDKDRAGPASLPDLDSQRLGAQLGSGPPRVTRFPLAAVAAGLLLFAMGLAAALAWGLGLVLDAGLGKNSESNWVGPAAAALGVVVVAVPLALLAMRLRGAPSLTLPITVPAMVGPEGVPRALFDDLAAREWSRSRRYGTGAALLIVQLDRFARLVESRGMPAADAALTELLRQTAPTLRGVDLLTRLSECEIAVFLAQADATGALDVAERIRERAEQLEVPLAGNTAQRLRITVSVGVANLRPAHLNLQALNEDAVSAVDAARQAGGNCVRAAPIDIGLGLRPGGGWRDGSRAPR